MTYCETLPCAILVRSKLATENDIENAIKVWLKHAKQRSNTLDMCFTVVGARGPSLTLRVPGPLGPQETRASVGDNMINTAGY
ncbi:hypothetical protein PUN28_020787 [Cardiocondyla obscurior]|uniref:Uncharacterized protein n=1 Tax=Cardiocondyla obscurior TaxID=286306 RepID=A0AAW2EAM0_9HYME